MTGAITQHYDAVNFLVTAFFIFFFCLVYWLRREDKREGYPMRDVTPIGLPIEGFPKAPPPKTFERLKGDAVTMPHAYGDSKVNAVRLLRFPGAPLVPLGNPLLAEVGPGAYPLRENEPLLAHDTPQVVPLRVTREWSVARNNTDPRGMPVYDSRHVLAGTVSDLWVDRAVKILRYLEVTLASPTGAAPPEPLATRNVLVPIYFTEINRRHGFIRVNAILAHQFPDVPALSHPDQITAREEDRVSAYFASGKLFSRGMHGALPVSSRLGLEG